MQSELIGGRVCYSLGGMVRVGLIERVAEQSLKAAEGCGPGGPLGEEVNAFLQLDITGTLSLCIMHTGPPSLLSRASPFPHFWGISFPPQDFAHVVPLAQYLPFPSLDSEPALCFQVSIHIPTPQVAFFVPQLIIA